MFTLVVLPCFDLCIIGLDNRFHEHPHTCQGLYSVTQEREIEGIYAYALLMNSKANKPETVLCRAPTFSLLLVSHGGIT